MDSVPPCADINSIAHGSFTADDVYLAIASGEIAFDLQNELVSESHSLAFRDHDALAFAAEISKAPAAGVLPESVRLEVGAKITYDGRQYKVVLLGEDELTLRGEGSEHEMNISTVLKLHHKGKLDIQASQLPNADPEDWNQVHALTPEEISRANERAELLRLAEVSPKATPVSLRTLQRWRKQMREASSHLAKKLALVGRARFRGNRTRKIPQEVVALVSDVIKNVFNTPTAPNRKKAYKDFIAQCHESLLRPCSYAAFCAEARRLGSTAARFGKRIAYQLEPIVWYLIATEPIHGVRPFEYVHIDHTELDLVVIDAYNKKSLGKAWLTLAIDAESRAIVGFYLTFERPSYRSFMMVLRDIVRRHGRLPGSFIVDNGKEFHSEDFKRVCALLGIHVKFRPAGKPRHGSVMERVFRTTNQQFIHNLAGNTKLMRHVRMVTKSVHPTQFASWTLAALAAGLDYYFGTLYGTEPHPAHGDGPDAHLRRRLSETGLRLNRLARLSRTFLIETCPMVDRKGTRVVDGQRGVKVHHLFYWTNAFLSGWDGHEIPVRVDPWDPRVCYVRLRNDWHQCKCRLVGQLRHLTWIELRYYFAEMRKRGGVKPLPLTAERAVQWLTAMDPSAFDPRLRAQQTEALYVFSRFGMTAVDSEAFSDGTNVDSQLNARASLDEPMEAAISGNIANDGGNAFVEEDTVYDLY